MSPRERPDAGSERLSRYRRGHTAEWVAAAFLLCRGYRILARRYKTTSGEIDLIAIRRGRLAFVEVKRRRDDQLAQSAITPRQRQRIHRAAEIFVARHPRYAACERSFDAVFILPRRWPRHIAGGL